ncbi:putative potassium transport system protein kup 2 [Candidatus Nitrotoga sp. HW29]|uniref:potassium transporter Kup n=1 Tax=Candidatus Nitrotoga sp. HW29 TaxID=2886963 RepID=UPI001EF28DDE|nr:potassium transporter Kup [Candidatus Nitrotoga sp. HW29]CAH1903736.1 putative potassium transport system protein kup 2 [Candidatus Nitrotoga sp. HW29]
MSSPQTQQNLSSLMLCAIGVVYGDIGTSPLYALKETFAGHHPLPITEANVLGVLSIMFWTIMVLVSLKYVTIIMRADNHGEGGSLALLALASELNANKPKSKWLLAMLGIFAAALFYGDSMITPAISVLSAVEGLNIIAPQLDSYVLPITIMVLTALFFVQKRGTGAMGMAFGPIMILWFSILGVLGISSIAHSPHVLLALNPVYAYQFLFLDPWLSFFTLGSVVLAVTGGEALYTDMGHFGRFPIRLTWFSFVLPALVFNYFGQGALLLDNPQAVKNPFFLLAPEWAIIPMVLLATAATVIASQAVISGAFSVASQSVQMGFLPRMEIRQTSSKAHGQIYVPFTNWTLYLAVIYLVLTFQSSSNLAAAYGIAVTGTMMIDTILIAFVLIAWRWSPLLVIPLIGTFFCVDLAYFTANAIKIPQGGWFPIGIALVSFIVLTTWKRGRKLLFEEISRRSIPIQTIVDHVGEVNRAHGTAVFLVGVNEGAPAALLHNLKHNQVLHERNVLLSVIIEDKPFVTKGNRILINDLGKSFYRVKVFYGFMQTPDVPAALGLCMPLGLSFDMMDTTFFTSRALIVSASTPGMMKWREWIFIIMSKNAMNATEFFKIPTNRVIEMGTRIEI